MDDWVELLFVDGVMMEDYVLLILLVDEVEVAGKGLVVVVLYVVLLAFFEQDWLNDMRSSMVDFDVVAPG